MGEQLSRRAVLVISASLALSACSRVMFYTRFSVEPSASAAYQIALREFLQHYSYRETSWRPNFESRQFKGVYEGWRTRFWLSEVGQNLFAAEIAFKWDIIDMFAPGELVYDIGNDFKRRISSVEGVSIAEGY